jgi:COPI associated protein
MSQKFKCNFKTIAVIINGIAGIGLVALGLYKLIGSKITGPRFFFLGIYYIFFGVVLVTSEFGPKKVLFWLEFIFHPIGKSLYLLFLAALTLDIDRAAYLLCSIVLIICAIFQLIYYIVSFKNDESSKQPEKLPADKSSEPSGFGKVNLDAEDTEKNPQNPKPEILQKRK